MSNITVEVDMISEPKGFYEDISEIDHLFSLPICAMDISVNSPLYMFC